MIENLENKIFGKVRVLAKDESNPIKKSNWLCVCECGEFFSVIKHKLLRMKSCGCIHPKYDTVTFKNRANQVHKYKYDYTNTVYLGDKLHVDIVCPIHGKFSMLPSLHLKLGQGCFACNGSKFNTISFIEKAQKIHKNFYSYERAEFVGYHKPITITCPIHGDFTQQPSNHFQGSGCKQCYLDSGYMGYLLRCESTPLGAKQGHIYVLKAKLGQEVFGKIGIGVYLNNRYNSYKKDGVEIEEILCLPMSPISSFKLEQQILEQIGRTGNKFNTSLPFRGRTECFKIEYLQEVLKLVENGLIE